MLSKSVTLLISTVKHLRNANQLLLIPLTIYSGLEQSFLGAQFTKVTNVQILTKKIFYSLGICLMYTQCQICRFNFNSFQCL